MGLFDGKVVIITGSGGGIGRAHALAFAKEGASIVVNDLGVARDGASAGAKLADQVVEEIKAAGGKAVANYDSVASFEGARNLVKTGLDAFGKIDVLVNNAGILRDKSMLKMDEAMFDIVVAVHLKGTWNCTKHAAEAMVAAGKGGRIVNTTSIAGLKGNFGQTNYGSAKAGIWGMTLTTAIELKKHNITCNAIAPMAKTRMTEDIDVVPEDMKPEHISPVVLWLASEGAGEVSGRCFGVHPPRIFEYKMEMTDGAETPGGLWTVEEIARRLPEIERLGLPPAAAPAAAAAPAPRDPAAIVDALVKAAPGFFKADKASGVKSTFHLHVKGAKPYTIKVENGACTVSEGHQGTATCNVKTDVDTYIGMAEGKVNPQKAFMEQKLSADNLGEAMKYATLFRQPKPDELAKIMGSASGSAGGAAPQAAAAAAPASPKEQIEEIFRRMPEVFVPAKATGWKAAILWKVDGAGDFTVEVADGKCTTKQGAPEKATCTVKLKAETLLGMVSGAVNPQKAFMEGKITADNLGDMMKFGPAFDLKKAAAAAASAPKSTAGAAPQAAAAAPASPKDQVAEIFRRMPEVFIPAKAANWKAAILWKVDGAGDFTVEVADGKCTTKQGAPEKATCTVKLKAETLLGMATGAVNPQKAFMEGKITADNLGDMMKFGPAFDLKKAAAAASSAGAPAVAPAAAAPAAPAQEGVNRSYIGRVYGGGAHFVRPDDMKAFALATNDPNPHFMGEKEPYVAPPVFPVKIFKDCMFKPMMDPGLNVDLLRVVHGEEEIVFHRPLRPWDLVTTRAIVHSVEDKSSGQVIRLAQKGYVEGELVVEAMSAIFIRGTKKGEKKEEAAAAPATKPTVAFSQTTEVTQDQPRRYAAISGDENPIHLDENVARSAGLPGVILHGLCTMAFTSRAIVTEACEGNPARLKRIFVRFSKPVLPGDKITTSAWKTGEKDGVTTYGFEAVNQAGVQVITNGAAEVAK